MRIAVQLLLVVEDAVLDEQVVAADRLAHLGDVVGARIVRRLYDRGVLVTEGEHLVAVQGDVGADSVGKSRCVVVAGGNAGLEAAVLHRAYVHVGAGQSGNRRHRNVEEHVRGPGIVVVEGEGEIALPQTRVYADVHLGVLLPAQVVVGDLVRIDLGCEAVTNYHIVCGAVEGEVLGVANLGVAGLAYGGAYLHVVQHALRSGEERLVADTPAEGCRREVAPAGVRRKAGRGVTPDGCGKHIASLVGILGAYEPACEGICVAVVVGVVKVYGLALRGAYLVVAGYSCRIYLRSLYALLLGVVGGNCADAVVAETAVEGYLVGYGPVGIAVAPVPCRRIGEHRRVAVQLLVPAYILVAPQRQGGRTVVVALVGIVVAAQGEFVAQTLYEFVGGEDVAHKVDLFPLVGDLLCQGDRVEHLVGLGVPVFHAQVAVHIPVVAVVRVIYREDRRSHKGRGDYAVGAVLSVGGHVVGEGI